MRGARTTAACLVAMLLACACAGTTPKPNRTEEQASALNLQAGRAYERGDYPRAAALYERAMTLNKAVENTEGVAINALSLARALQANGDSAGAHLVLDALLADAPLPLSPPRRAEAQARKALLYLDAGDSARALAWSDQALRSCADCPALAAIQTLRGRAALAGGDPATALVWSGRALASNVSAGERANALRLSGEAQLAQSQYRAALAPLEQALALDHAAGLPARIFLDLMALGRAHRELGEHQEARDYFSRARDVSAAAGNEAGARAASSSLERLPASK